MQASDKIALSGSAVAEKAVQFRKVDESNVEVYFVEAWLPLAIQRAMRNYGLLFDGETPDSL